MLFEVTRICEGIFIAGKKLLNIKPNNIPPERRIRPTIKNLFLPLILSAVIVPGDNGINIDTNKEIIVMMIVIADESGMVTKGNTKIPLPIAPNSA